MIEVLNLLSWFSGLPGLPGLAGLPGLGPAAAGLPPGFPNPLQLAAAAAAGQPPPTAASLGSPTFNPLGLPFPAGAAGAPPGLAGARRELLLLVTINIEIKVI